MNAAWPKALEAWATGGVDWVGDTIHVRAVEAGYTYDAADEFMADLTGVGATVFDFLLAGRSATGGVLDADPHTEPGVAPGSTVTQLIVYVDSGSSATSRLLLFLDTGADTAPFSFTTNGGNVVVSWPASKLGSI